MKGATLKQEETLVREAALPPASVRCSLDSGAQDGGKARSRAIDGLRGAAILAVIFVHTAYAWPSIGRGFIQLSSLGRYGVDVFFVLSGWVLTHLYFSTAVDERPGLGVRLQERLIRLAPLYWLGIVGYGILGPRWGWAGDGSVGEIWANVFFLNGWDTARASVVVPGGWSISVEFWAGAAFLSLLPVLNTAGRALACLAGIFLVSRLWPMGGEGNTPWMHLPSLLLGALAWRIRATGRRRWLARCAPVLPVLAAAGIASLHHAGLGVVDRVLQAGGAGFLLVLWAGETSWDSAAGRALAWLGTLSYGLYLVHFAMIELAVWVTIVLMPPGAADWACGALSFALATGLSVPAAWLLDRKFDRPLRRCARAYFARMRPASGAANL